MKKKPINPDNNRHPYMQPKNWVDGTLCFWRNNPWYSDKAKKYYEDWVKQMKKDIVNPSKLMDKPM